MLAAVALAVFYLGYAHDHFASPKRLHWLFLLLIIGFAIRGPIGLVIPTGVLCSYYLLNRQWRQLFTFGLIALALLAACVGLSSGYEFNKNFSVRVGINNLFDKQLYRKGNADEADRKSTRLNSSHVF